MNNCRGRQKRRRHSLLSPGPQERPEFNCFTSQFLDLMIRILLLRHKLDNTSGMREVRESYVVDNVDLSHAAVILNTLEKKWILLCSLGVQKLQWFLQVCFPFLCSLIKKDTSILKSNWLPGACYGWAMKNTKWNWKYVLIKS